ncbi:MAG: cupredoxin domain-containing protein [Proteobacteria bacterium]|nr:cupredoxin domain-containing protein [Pseudomonadota bacterium]
MLRAVSLSLVVVSLTFTACKKDDAGKPAAAPLGTVGADGIRHISIEANNDGYTPDKIPGKPGEKLMLVFTRTADSSCIAQLKAPDGKLYDLPMNKPIEVAVTVPTSGRVEFACGMDMVKGVVVADPRS